MGRFCRSRWEVVWRATPVEIVRLPATPLAHDDSLKRDGFCVARLLMSTPIAAKLLNCTPIWDDLGMMSLKATPIWDGQGGGRGRNRRDRAASPESEKQELTPRRRGGKLRNGVQVVVSASQRSRDRTQAGVLVPQDRGKARSCPSSRLLRCSIKRGLGCREKVHQYQAEGHAADSADEKKRHHVRLERIGLSRSHPGKHGLL